MIWSTRTSQILRKYKLPHKVIDCVEWCPDIDTRCLLAVANEDTVHIIAPELFAKAVNDATKACLKETAENYRIETAGKEEKDMFVKWAFKSQEDSKQIAVTL